MMPERTEWGGTPPLDPIFIHGITERSGTNFLFHLLCIHPNCDHGGPIWENYLLYRADLLVRYVEGVYRDWNPKWEVNTEIGPPDLLLSHLGDGLIAFLNRQRQEPDSRKRLVTKTPSVTGLNFFPRLFPRAPLLIVVRDGRAVVESGIRSFGWSFEAGARKWAEAADAIIDLCAKQGSAMNARSLIVRYEDLFLDTEAQLRRIFGHVGLNPGRYDYDAARSLPVFGSSEQADPAGQGLHWNPVQRHVDFDPLARFRDWDQKRHDRFNWLAGPALAYFGYELQRGRSGRFSTHCQRLSDLAWDVRGRVVRISPRSRAWRGVHIRSRGDGQA